MQELYCDWCEQKMDESFWSNIVREFCSLECTNKYLESEGFLPITQQGESSPGIRPDLQ